MLVLNNNESDNTLIQDQTSSKIKQEKEWGGQKGPEPTRYGDWEKNGRVSDF